FSAKCASGGHKDQRELLEYNFQKVSKQPDESTLTLIALECDLSEELAAVSALGLMGTSCLFIQVEEQPIISSPPWNLTALLLNFAQMCVSGCSTGDDMAP
uniref:Uncharacterized protein n=1 Tax=Erpetoichthys calabaricus TaxID=27687 RepID=A0A8C4T6E2_ERPCA